MIDKKRIFLENYFWDIQAYKDNPTEEELQKLIWLMYLEGVHDGSTEGYDSE